MTTELTDAELAVYRATTQPDGWILRHGRMTDTVTFGPFATLEELDAWLLDHPDVHGAPIPCWRSVDWNRRG